MVASTWNSGFPLYRDATYVGAPRRPTVVAASGSTQHDIQVVDWVIPDRVEVVSEGNQAGGPTKFCFYMADRATWISRPGRAMQEVPPNEIVVINSDNPVRTISLQNTRHLTLIVPQWIVARHTSTPGSLYENTGTAPYQSAEVARNIMHAIRSSLGITQFSAVCSSLVEGLLGTLAAPDDEDKRLKNASRDTRLELVNQVIAQHFGDPDFSVSAIAQKLNISTRYLHALCHDLETPARMLLHFRLRQAEALLGSPAWRDRSITDIAFACGFNSSSQFSTSFRSYFGNSPRDLRRKTRP